jgi:glycine/D-amino acid oxidase-like deaminating enzyme
MSCAAIRACAACLRRAVEEALSMSGGYLYHDDMYRFGEPQGSYWEFSADNTPVAAAPLSTHERCDVAVIGGGYTGLSAAYHLCKYHHIDTRVLEAGHMGWGASGRNAGFCGIGGTSLSLKQMLQKYGLEETRRFYRSQIDGVELVRRLLAEEGVDAQTQGEAELEVAPSPKAFAALVEHATAQRDLLGFDNQVLSAEEFRSSYFESSELHGAVVQRPAFSLHPMRYLRGLAAAAGRNGARLHTHSEVIEWTKQGGEHVLVTRGGSLRARNVIFATNGFMPEHLHPAFLGRPLPMISAMVVTRPLTADELSAHRWQTKDQAITSKRILNYYRVLPDNRLLFGGRGHATGSDAGAQQTFATLSRRLGQLWPRWQRIPIEYRWHGLICITLRLTPALGRLSEDPTVLFAYGYHGNGINTATWSGKQLADWLAATGARGARTPDSLPLMMRGISPRFPLASLRLRYLQARLALFRLQDALD